MNIIIGVVREAYVLLSEMAPYLLFGFFFAGILHIFFSTETIARHLGKSDMGSVIKASVLGIPLPLCSCGVIPAALSLRKEGASKGAVLSFLISTPTTGIDSIFATYALLGGLFAVYRVIAAFCGAFIVGILANAFLKHEETAPIKKVPVCKVCSGECEHAAGHHIMDKIKGVFSYGFGRLMKDAGGWLIMGIMLGGIIAYLIPEQMIRSYIGSGFTAIVVMMIVGIPMYICSSGSIPIAAALMMKGLNPGAAFAFLFSGPATNTVTMVAIGKNLGKQALFLYIIALFSISIGLGVCFDYLWQFFSLPSFESMHHHAATLPLWLKHLSAFVLLLLIGGHSLQNIMSKRQGTH